MRNLAIGLTITIGLAQAATVADVYTPSDLAGVRGRLEAKHAAFASEDLKKYGNHYTMVAYREATGSSEIHEKEADLFVVEKGEATIIIGGKMVGGKETKPGELRGTSITGGEKTLLKEGDVVHIPAGVPHQMLIAPGKTITYFVMKVTGQ